MYKKGAKGRDLERFVQVYIKNLKLSSKTKENYAVDAKKFFEWTKDEYPEVTIFFLSDNFNIITKSYIRHLLLTSTPKRTIKRRLTTIKHIGELLIKTGYSDESEIDYPSTPKASHRPPILILASSLFLVLTFMFVAANTNEKSKVFATEVSSDLPNPTSKGIKMNQQTNYLADSKVEVPLESENYNYQDTSSLPLVDDSLSGTATIYKDENQVTIENPNVTQNSLIFLTSKTQNVSLYIKDQGIGYFTIALNGLNSEIVRFNWLIQK